MKNYKLTALIFLLFSALTVSAQHTAEGCTGTITTGPAGPWVNGDNGCHPGKDHHRHATESCNGCRYKKIIVVSSHSQSYTNWVPENDKQHTATCNTCGAFHHPGKDHQLSWAGLVYGCSLCSYENTGTSGEAEKKSEALGQASKDAGNVSVPSSKVVSESSIVTSGTKEGNSFWDTAVSGEAFGLKASGYAHSEAEKAARAEEAVSLKEVSIQKEEEDFRDFYEVMENERYCTICGEKILAGNPVNVVSGAKVERFSDLSIPGNGLSIEVIRNYNNQKDTALSLGQGWSFNYDSRIVFGVKKQARESWNQVVQSLNNAKNNLVQADNHIRSAGSHYGSAFSAYQKAHDSFKSAEGAVKQAEKALTEAKNLLSKAESAFMSHNTLSYPYNNNGTLRAAILSAENAITSAAGVFNRAELQYKDALKVYRTKKAVSSQAESKKNAAASARKTFMETTAPRIRKEINDVISWLTDEEKRISEELTVADSQAARNKFSADMGRRNKELFGNGYILWTDLNGTERLFITDSPVDPDSQTTLSDGTKNVWPKGTTFSPLYGEDWSVVMDSKGAFTVTAEDKSRVYTYNEFGQLTSITDRDGNALTFDYSNGHLRKVTDSYGRYISVTTNDNKQITSVTDFTGRSVAYGYDGRFLTSFRDAENYEYRFGYDSNGNLTSVENPDFTSRSYRYEETDGKFRVAEEWDEMGYSQSFFYTESQTIHRDRRGFDTVYDITPSKHISQVTYPDGRIIKEEFNPEGHKSAHINSAGYRHSFYPDSEGNVTREATVYGGEVVREYHPLFDLPVKEEIIGNSIKNSVVISYIESGNGIGRPESILLTNPETGELDHNLKIFFTYDSQGRIISETDLTGKKTTYAYRDLFPLSGSTITITKNGVSSVLTLDGLGRITEMKQGTLHYIYEYDDLNRIVKERELGNNRERITTSVYNYHGIVQLSAPYYSTETPELTKDFTYSPRRELLFVKENEGSETREVSFTYDEEGNPLTQTDPEGRTNWTKYDEAGNPEAAGYYKNGEEIELTRYHYDSAGRISAVSQNGTKQVEFSYPDVFTTVEKRFGGELTTTTIKDDLGRVYKKHSESKDGYRTETVEYDFLSRPVKTIIDQDGETGSETYTYDILGRIVSVTDIKGDVSTISYFDESFKKTIIAPGNITTEFQYDESGRLLSTGSPEKGYVSYNYDDFGRVSKITSPENFTESFIYDAQDRISRAEDRRGNLTTLIYGDLNRFTTITNHLGQEWRTDYTLSGQVSSQKDPRGAVSSYEYNPWTGAIDRTLGAEGEETTYHYDDFGFLKALKNIGKDDFRLTRYYKDAYGRLTSMRGEEGYVIGYDYDYNGQLRKMTRGEGSAQKTLREWDYAIDGTPLAERYTLDGVEYTSTFDYSLAGVLKSKTNFRGQKMDYTYDEAGRLNRVIYPDDSFYDYDYDPMGNISQISGPDDYKVNYSWNKEGRLLTENYPLSGESLKYTYNNFGDLASISGPGRHDKQSYEYDSLGRLAQTSTKGSGRISYNYDDNGNLTKVEYGSSDRTRSEYFYDLSNRMTGYRTIKSQGRHEKLIDGYIYHYDKYGNVDFQTDKEGKTTRYRYDGMDRLYQVWYPSTSGKSKASVKERKDLGLNGPTEEFIPHTVEALTDIGNVENTLTASFEEIFGQWTSKNPSFLKDNYHYERFTYDLYGRRSERTNAFGTIRYDYDTQDRLKRAGNRSYNYDADGNRIYEYYTEEPWDISVDGLNVRVEESPLFINGQSAGNRVWSQRDDTRSITHKKKTWSAFEYRADNRMTSYKNSNEEHWLYRYDGLGRRYEKERVIDSYFRKPEKDSWHTNRTFYAGTSHSILAEITDTENWNEISTGQKYLLGPGGRAYGSEAFYGWNGHKWNSFGWKNRKYYHYDRLGSVSSISLDKPGLAGNYFEYGPFGQVLQGKHSWSWEHKGSFQKDSDIIGFTGKKIDSESGNYHFPFREYDPLTAQWTTSDPVKDGELWYGYVANNPIRYVDPLGLKRHGLGICDVSLNSNDYTLYGIPRFQKTAYTDNILFNFFAVLGNGSSDILNFPIDGINGLILHPPQRVYHDGWAEVGKQELEGLAVLGIGLYSAVQNEVKYYKKTPREQIGQDILAGPLYAKNWETTLSYFGSVYFTVKVLPTSGSQKGRLLNKTAISDDTFRMSPQELGKAGERAVGDIGPKIKIEINGRNRIPDGLLPKVLSEVKNVKQLSYTRQLRDFAAYAIGERIRFDLYVRGSTYLSGPLKDAIIDGTINLRYIPGVK